MARARPAAVEVGNNADIFNAVAYGNGVYAAAGTDGILYSSTDGTHWTAQNSGIGPGGQYTDMTFAGGVFLAVGEDAAGATHATQSADGSSWTDTVIALPPNTLADNIGYGNGTFVLANSVAATSTDGAHWSSQDIVPGNISDFFSAPAYANGVFAVVGYTGANQALLYTSSDNGTTWASAYSFAATDEPQAILSTGSELVVLGSDNACSCGLVLTSTDGVTWQRQSNTSADVGEYWGSACGIETTYFSAPVLWDGSRFLTYNFQCFNGYTGTAESFTAYTSADGVHWVAGNAYTVPSDGPDNNNNFSYHAVAVTPMGYLAASNDPMVLTSSPDFATWTTALNLQGQVPGPNSGNGGGGGFGWPVLALLAVFFWRRRKEGPY